VDEDRLMRCFTAAFPGVDPTDIKEAKNFDAIPGSDSLRLVNLLAVLDEEYDVEIELPDSPDFKPYDGVKQYLLQHGLIP